MNINDQVNIKKKMKNPFADKATLVLRAMLKDRDREWVVRDFTDELPISLGMAGEVLMALEKSGYVERQKRGPRSYTILTEKDRLIRDWLNHYDFSLNTGALFFNQNLRLNQMKRFFKQRNLEDKYALTLHTGANLETSYVQTENIYLYLEGTIFDRVLPDIRQQLDLKQLVHGGNVHLIRPYYKNSVFFGMRKIRGFSVVSNLQLYLDLYHFRPRGMEHAEFLKTRLEEEGAAL